MPALAGGDRILDSLQRLRRETPSHAVVIGDEVTPPPPRFTRDHCAFRPCQFHPPEAPPPPNPPPPQPKPPPPPPNTPPPPKPPPDQPLPLPVVHRPGPPRPANAEKLITTNATIATIAAMSTEPAKSQAAPPTMPAPTTEPPTLPRIERRIAPIAGTATSRIKASVPTSKPCDGARRRGSALGSGLPSLTTPMMRSMPALRPAANCPLLNSGAIVAAMMRREVKSDSTPAK